VQLVKLSLMETLPTGSPPPRELPIVGGHLALDFANTVDDPLGPARHDHAATYDDVVGWAVRARALTGAQASRLLRTAASHARDTAATVERAHELREALNEIFGGIADGRPGAPEHWTRLRPFVVDAVAAAALEGTGPGARHWAWPQADDLAVVLHPVASAAADLLVGEDLLRVRRCARCPWLFLDGSKNHSRRWCDMNDCGRAQKIERYVARRAAARRRATGDAG
jgi:predicted RNA-binding Zn ribbon-like protein